MTKEGEKTKYLYGASVQGIQNFIFQTNKLKEIVGASELVEQICTTAFDDFAISGKSILRAAGNIKHIFDSENECKKAVLEFPRKVMTMAPGITISQAVVQLKEDESDYADKANELEKRLRTQRNKPVRSMTLGLMAISRAPSTGLPAVKQEGKELIDEASDKKTGNDQLTISLMKKLIDSDNLKHKQVAYDFEDMKGKNSWIAVIHADGNGVGNIVQEVCKNPTDAKTFSEKLNKITNGAYNSVEKYFWTEKDKKENKELKIPIRPVILGGDDLTVICRADIAIEFAKVFLEEFEEQSKNQLAEFGEKYEVVKKGLTVCAGIAFVKSSYPFHYAVDLAESLCGQAKKAAKKIDEKLAPSCLMFHKVQDSFVEDFDEIVRRELMPQSNLSFKHGPYYCGNHPQRPDNTIDKLLQNVKYLEGTDGNAIKSQLRQWLSLLFNNIGTANQKMKRVVAVGNQSIVEKLQLEKYLNLQNQVASIPYHDILSLASILFTETKEGEKKYE
jgi:hypothetical protein